MKQKNLVSHLNFKDKLDLEKSLSTKKDKSMFNSTKWVEEKKKRLEYSGQDRVLFKNRLSLYTEEGAVFSNLVEWMEKGAAQMPKLMLK